MGNEDILDRIRQGYPPSEMSATCQPCDQGHAYNGKLDFFCFITSRASKLCNKPERCMHYNETHYTSVQEPNQTVEAFPGLRKHPKMKI